MPDKYYPPKLGAIIFALCNLDPENWKNIFRIEITGKNGSAIIPNKLFSITIAGARKALDKITDAELYEKTAALEEKFEKDK